MAFQSVLAVYFIMFFLCLFMVLPFGVRTSEEAGVELVPGQVESAPHHFPAGRVALRTALVALVPTLLVYGNYRYGWVTRTSLEGVLHWLGAPPLE